MLAYLCVKSSYTSVLLQVGIVIVEDVGQKCCIELSQIRGLLFSVSFARFLIPYYNLQTVAQVATDHKQILAREDMAY